MIFQKVHNNEIITYKFHIENETCSEITGKVLDHLWPYLSINVCNLKFRYQDNDILDFDKPLIQLVNNQDAVIDCYISEDGGNFLKRCNLIVNGQSSEMRLDNIPNIDHLSNYLKNKLGLAESEILNISHIGVEIVPLIEGFVEVNSIFEHFAHERLLIPFKNREKVIELKERIRLKYYGDEIILFLGFQWLNEDDYIYQYEIKNGSTIKYAPLKRIANFERIEGTESPGDYCNSFDAEVISTEDPTKKIKIKIKQYEYGSGSQGIQNFKPMIREILSFHRTEQNPRFVQLKGFYMQDEIFYVGLEHMEGGSLHNFIEIHISLDEKNIARLSKNILEALKELHQDHRIYHGDLNSFNILLDEKNEAKISGFSLSRFFAGVTCNDMVEGFTTSKQSLKFNYSAPEILNQEIAGFKSDIWSFGAILIEMVTGRMPLHSKAKEEIVRHVTTEYTIPYELPPHLMDSPIKQMIDLCVKKEMEKRPSAEELLNKFSEFFKMP